MTFDVNLFATALLLTLIGAEGALAWWKARPVYRLADTLSHTAAGLGQLALQAMLGITLLKIYTWMQAHSPFTLSMANPAAWVVGYLALEFCLYWRHRAGHEVAALWAVHEVHHQSSEFNYAVGQRVGLLQWVQTSLFIWPLAVLGIPVPMFGALFGSVHLYNLLLHTQLVRSLGPLEQVLQTPALHRVHHGRNAVYLDKNYGFTITLFDRLFGTHQPEHEPVLFGTTRDLASYSVVDNNLRPIGRLARRMAEAPRWIDGVFLALRHPAWDPSSGRVRFPPETSVRRVPAERSTRSHRWAAVAAAVLGMGTTLALAQLSPVLSLPARLAMGSLAGALLLLSTLLPQELS